MEKLKDILKNTLNYLGDSIEEYNVGAWALFRDVMSAEISSQYIFGGGRKPDENLLEYEFPFIERANRLTRDQEATKGLVTPHPSFTYYTPQGPTKTIAGKPVLPEPETDTLKSDYKPTIEGEQTLSTNEHGVETLGEYDEQGTLSGNIAANKLTGDNFTTDISKYSGETLLSRTRELFKSAVDTYNHKKFATIISGFHTQDSRIPVSEINGKAGLQQTYTKEYGMSKGRNLLKAEKSGPYPNSWQVPKDIDVNGYEDPYCRVWTWHKQYDSLGDLIRPLVTGDENGGAMSVLDNGDSNWQVMRSDNGVGFESGGIRLGQHGVMYDNRGATNGFVNITPQNDGNGKVVVDVKKCMFSIENLAWKGTFHSRGDEENGLSDEQKGPLGGRIMWFPPYDLSFNETTSANWTTNDFIGRGEPIFTYANTVRTGTLSFKLLIDHPAILDYWDRRAERGNPAESGPGDVGSKEQEMNRFFAGCSILTASSDLGRASMTVTVGDKAIKREDYVKNGGPKIQFLVFYPNNYSGKDDIKGGPVNPITYLVNGVGANRYQGMESAADLPTTHTSSYYTTGRTRIGGYEMRQGVGVSARNDETTSDNIAEILINGLNPIMLVKMLGDVQGGEYPYGGTEAQQSEWHKRRYYYRADKTTLNQILVGKENDGAVSYIDKSSTCLNSTGYSNAFSALGVPDGDSSLRCSLADMFVAVNNDSKNVLNGLYNQARVDTIRGILTGGKSKITQVISYGYASNQGNNKSQKTNTDRNNTLASNRANTANEWVKSFIKDKDKTVKYSVGGFSIADKKPKNSEDSNDPIAKLQRCALVEIYYQNEDTENAGDTVVGSVTDSVIHRDSNEANISGNTETQEVPQATSTGITSRYDNEARFFDRIGKEEPFMAKLLSERIKNFDPVFHSMSPEGFNTRLTFLNQCMRQGPTSSASDTNGRNTNNLAFGRPPVCVLRVGDFYNTKIVITNMTISYDPLVWDLNQEGIGVMPMMANISLTFNFIGGSDLGGPIQRLQNATSFNYYANANVYDNRAETIEYSDPDTVDFRAYDPFVKPNN